MARVEERLAAIRPPEPHGTVNVSEAELAAPPGQYPLAYTNPLAQQAAEATAQVQAQAIAARPSPRMVAFIPRQDPYNPKQTTFITWINGRELRGQRGQVMLLSSGHGSIWRELAWQLCGHRGHAGGGAAPPPTSSRTRASLAYL